MPRLCRTVSLAIALVMLATTTRIDPAVAGFVTIECAPPASPAAAAARESTEPPPAVPFPDDGGNLMVFAAASLTDSFNEMKATLEAAHPGLSITYNFAGSPALVTQLKEGAEADLFAAASVAQMAAAQGAGVIAGELAIFAHNRLAIVVPSDNPASIASPADLAYDGVKLVLARPEVPAGQYARQSICKAAADTATFGEEFAARVGENIVSEEDNVKAVLTKVRLGEADAGIVYTTDVTAEVADEVLVIGIPEAINVIADYTIAPVAGGYAELAAAFIGYLLGPEGQATLVKHGFEPAT
jgi:molybdate transport system substrate-binding protein